MGLIPWEDLFYNIKGKNIALTNLYNDYQQKKDIINLKSDKLGKLIGQIQQLSIYNSALLMNVSLGNMSDKEFKDFLLTSNLPKPVYYTPEVYSALSALATTAQIPLLIKFISFSYQWWKLPGASEGLTNAAGGDAAAAASLGNVANNAAEATVETNSFSTVETADGGIEMVPRLPPTPPSEVASDIESGSEAGASDTTIAEASSGLEEVADETTVWFTEGTLAALKVIGSGAAIFLALGVDLIVGWVDGAKEDKQIKAATASLSTALATIDLLITKLDTSISDGQKMVKTGISDFVSTVNFMSRIATPTFKYNYDQTDISDANWALWLAALQAAGDQYLLISKIRSAFNNFYSDFIIDNPDKTFGQAEFDRWQSNIIDGRLEKYSREDMIALINYIAKNSAEMRKYVKAAV